MVFPNKDYLTFSMSAEKPVVISFPKKKPKKKDMVRCCIN